MPTGLPLPKSLKPIIVLQRMRRFQIQSEKRQPMPCMRSLELEKETLSFVNAMMEIMTRDFLVQQLRRNTGGDRMQEFQIEIKEELARVETIQAETLGEAIDKAMELYYDQKIILDAEDMKGVDFQPMQPEKTR